MADSTTFASQDTQQRIAIAWHRLLEVTGWAGYLIGILVMAGVTFLPQMRVKPGNQDNINSLFN